MWTRRWSAPCEEGGDEEAEARRGRAEQPGESGEIEAASGHLRAREVGMWKQEGKSVRSRETNTWLRRNVTNKIARTDACYELA